MPGLPGEVFVQFQARISSVRIILLVCVTLISDGVGSLLFLFLFLLFFHAGVCHEIDAVGVVDLAARFPRAFLTPCSPRDLDPWRLISKMKNTELDLVVFSAK